MMMMMKRVMVEVVVEIERMVVDLEVVELVDGVVVMEEGGGGGGEEDDEDGDDDDDVGGGMVMVVK